jgi:hypothetical protein
MDSIGRRNLARGLVIALLLAIVALFAYGVIHKVDRELVRPGVLESTPNKEAK